MLISCCRRPKRIRRRFRAYPRPRFRPPGHIFLCRSRPTPLDVCTSFRALHTTHTFAVLPINTQSRAREREEVRKAGGRPSLSCRCPTRPPPLSAVAKAAPPSVSWACSALWTCPAVQRVRPSKKLHSTMGERGHTARRSRRVDGGGGGDCDCPRFD